MEKTEDKSYYVYEHIRLDSMTCFYVGKGKRDRAYLLNRNEHHDRISEKYGHIVVIVKDCLTEQQAFELEKDLIDYYVFELGYGIDINNYKGIDDKHHLTNHMWGGQGKQVILKERKLVNLWTGKIYNTRIELQEDMSFANYLKKYKPNYKRCNYFCVLKYDEYKKMNEKEILEYLYNNCKTLKRNIKINRMILYNEKKDDDFCKQWFVNEIIGIYKKGDNIDEIK